VRYVLEIAFNGTNYHGWQSQKGSTTVQEIVEKALAKLLRSKVSIMGCGRTDAGVHASQFFLHFDYAAQLSEHFLFRMNQVLPKDIAVFQVFEVSQEFHARFKATYRKYIYKVCLTKNPFLENLSLHLIKEPNVEAMNNACKELLQLSDFAAFCKIGSDNKTTICKLMEAEWKYNDVEKTLEFHIKADRFLRNMVRAVVGTLLQVGYGEITSDGIKTIAETKNRSEAGKSVAARGLYLAEIGYNWNEFRK
jgi:tRNA pseudouridine38-40 synthase